MSSDHQVEAGKTQERSRSDLSHIKAWWRTLSGEGCEALPPPTRSRYTQSDGHGDAAELFARRKLPSDTSFVYWHWQSHDRSFNRSGALTSELLLHWGGDHAVVAAHLGSGPAGYQIVDGGPHGAFQLDRITRRDSSGMPDPEDPVAVRQFLDELNTPIDRSRLPLRYAPLTEIEAGWLHERLRHAPDLSSTSRFVTTLERREALTREEASLLLPVWRNMYSAGLTAWSGWEGLLHALLRHGHDQAWEVVTAIGARAVDIVSAMPSERSLTAVRELVLGDDRRTGISAWLRVYQAVREPDWMLAANAICAELTEHDAPKASYHALFAALRRALTDERSQEEGAAGRDLTCCLTLASVQLTTEERLARPLRVLAAEAARDRVAQLREDASRHGSRYAELTGTDAQDALEAADRFEAVREDLLTGTGPDLTLYEGGLCDVWYRYRTLTDTDIDWLRAQVADERTERQGIAFCLELLYSHGVAGKAEVDALLPRWKKVLAKQYKTTYTEWRHPLVTLTCLALDLDHPVAGDLLAWWGKDKPAWKDPLRLLTHLGAPTEAKAAELWDFITSGGHDQGHLMTWALIRARLDQVHPLTVADRLLRESGLRAYVLHPVLIGLADPAQPLWHYAIDPRSWDWWWRALEIADNPELSPTARAVGLEVARGHYLIRYPDQVRPTPTAADLKAAQDWIDQHADA